MADRASRTKGCARAALGALLVACWAGACRAPNVPDEEPRLPPNSPIPDIDRPEESVGGPPPTPTEGGVTAPLQKR